MRIFLKKLIVIVVLILDCKSAADLDAMNAITNVTVHAMLSGFHNSPEYTEKFIPIHSHVRSTLMFTGSDLIRKGAYNECSSISDGQITAPKYAMDFRSGISNWLRGSQQYSHAVSTLRFIDSAVVEVQGLMQQLILSEIDRFTQDKRYNDALSLTECLSDAENKREKLQTIFDVARPHLATLATEAKQLGGVAEQRKMIEARAIADSFADDEKIRLNAAIDTAYANTTAKVDSTSATAAEAAAYRHRILRELAQRVVND